jgi:ATP-dependent helicase HrpB
VTPNFPTLPITEHLDAIGAGIREHTISILQAPPGSGKTTILPLYLAQQKWLQGRSILILQPRRLAAKAVASRMSELLGEPLGATVGYQIRLERRRSAATRIEVITEGLLTRRLLSEPELSDVGLIIFDEFHERSIHADLGLPLAQEVAAVLRSDLKLLIMSATLDSLRLTPSLSKAWRYSFESKPFPVEIRYAPRDPRKPVWEETAQTIRAAVQQHEGDLLAFLPGAFEIEKCREILMRATGGYTVLPLYGELPYDQQQAALLPLPQSSRKVVIATNIAETSLTINGVCIVVDSGLQKVSRSSETGISTLKTERITRDAADQRAGRAGRTAPGVCIRLWSEQEHLALRPTCEPEIMRSDLAQPLLEIAAWGIRNPKEFDWITPPPARALDSASALLIQLGAIREDGSITKKGHALVRLGTHPRIGACCLTAHAHNLDAYAAALIPLLEERSLSTKGTRSADIAALTDALAQGEHSPTVSPRIRQLQALWLKRLEGAPQERLPQSDRVLPDAACGFLLASAFPERIAQRRADSRERYLLASGTGATLRTNDPLGSSEYIVVAEMQDRTEDAQIIRAAPLDPQLLTTHLRHLITEREELLFDHKLGVMVSRTHTVLGAIPISQGRGSSISSADLQAALLEYIRTPEGFASLPFSTAALSLQARSAWVKRTYPETQLPDISSESLRTSEPNWLLNRLPSSGRLNELSATVIEHALQGYFSWPMRQELDQIAPQTLTLPNGKTKAIDYSNGSGPTVEAMIQELFGLADTPRIGRYQAAVTLKLLSPARRPMQVTKDLASFWKNGYSAVRKELRGRYPKHTWPEDPTNGSS